MEVAQLKKYIEHGNAVKVHPSIGYLFRALRSQACRKKIMPGLFEETGHYCFIQLIQFLMRSTALIPLY